MVQIDGQSYWTGVYSADDEEDEEDACVCGTTTNKSAALTNAVMMEVIK